MDYITIGRFTLPTDLLSAFLSILIGGFIYWLKEKRSIGDWYWNSFFLYIAISKFSYVIFNFKMFMDTPISLLYFNGGTNGQILSFAGIAIYLYILIKNGNSRISTKESLFGYLTFFMIHETVLFLLTGKILAACLQALLLLGYIFFHYPKTRLHLQYAILFLMAEALILSLFSNLIFTENILLLGLGAFLLVLSRFNKEELPFE